MNFVYGEFVLFVSDFHSTEGPVCLASLGFGEESRK